MADAQDGQSSAQKDPKDWTTGGEDATGPQKSYLNTLAQQAGEPVDPDNLTKAPASQEINRLQEETGRGGQSATGGAGNGGDDDEAEGQA